MFSASNLDPPTHNIVKLLTGPSLLVIYEAKINPVLCLTQLTQYFVAVIIFYDHGDQRGLVAL